jgi:hypothetical protein
MVPLKQLMQHDTVEQAAQSEAEEQRWQERKAPANGNPLRSTSLTIAFSAPVIDVARLENHLRLRELR